MMAVVWIVKKKYKEEADVRNLIRYIVEKNDCGREYNNRFGIRKGDSAIAAKDILAIQKKYDKEPATIVRHIVISFSSKDIVIPEQVVGFAEKIAKYYNNKYQVLYGIHDRNRRGGENVHIHMIVSSTNFRTGKILHEGSDELEDFKFYVNNVVNSFNRHKLWT